MGAGASSRNQKKVAKVEIDSVDGQEAEVYHIDNAELFVGCPTKVSSSAEFQSSLAINFEKMSGIPVKMNTFADRSQAQLLVTRAYQNTEAKEKNENSKENKKKQDKSLYYLVPRIEPFSRISGICKILGDRDVPSKEKHKLVVGDFIRVGSVGLVVTEIRTSQYEKSKVIKDSQLWYLKPRAYSVLASENELPRPTMGSAMDPAAIAAGLCPGDYDDEGSEDECHTTNGTPVHSDEEADNNHNNVASAASSSSSPSPKIEVPLCYACCDDSELTYDNPLVSACKCKGGTRWLHLKCLERMLSGSSDGCTVVFQNQRHKPVCKVCREEYESQCLLPDSQNKNGPPRIVSVSMPSLRPPYICFKVVTDNAHNMSQQSIFNSSFVVSFASLMPASASSGQSSSTTSGGDQEQPSWPLLLESQSSGSGAAEEEEDNDEQEERSSQTQRNKQKATARRSLVIGRSFDVDVPLNYQTVSGRHAALHFEQGEFRLSDLKSSNGTFIYLREPFPLTNSPPLRIRMGRRTLNFSTVTPPPSFVSSAPTPSPPSVPPPTVTDTSSNTSVDLGGSRSPHTYVVVPNSNDAQLSTSSPGSDWGNNKVDDLNDPDKMVGTILPTYDYLLGLMKVNCPTSNILSSSSPFSLVNSSSSTYFHGSRSSRVLARNYQMTIRHFSMSEEKNDDGMDDGGDFPHFQSEEKDAEESQQLGQAVVQSEEKDAEESQQLGQAVVQSEEKDAEESQQLGQAVVQSEEKDAEESQQIGQ